MEETRSQYDNKVLRQQASGRQRIMAFQKWFQVQLRYEVVRFCVTPFNAHLQSNNRPVHLKRPMDSLLYK